jgi:hypothetical protein
MIHFGCTALLMHGRAKGRPSLQAINLNASSLNLKFCTLLAFFVTCNFGQNLRKKLEPCCCRYLLLHGTQNHNDNATSHHHTCVQEFAGLVINALPLQARDKLTANLVLS